MPAAVVLLCLMLFISGGVVGPAGYSVAVGGVGDGFAFQAVEVVVLIIDRRVIATEVAPTNGGQDFFQLVAVAGSAQRVVMLADEVAQWTGIG